MYVRKFVDTVCIVCMMYLSTSVCMYACMHKCSYIHVCSYVNICMYVCIYVCMCDRSQICRCAAWDSIPCPVPFGGRWLCMPSMGRPCTSTPLPEWSIRSDICIRMYVCIYVWMDVCMYESMNAYTSLKNSIQYIQVGNVKDYSYFICLWVYVCMYVCMYVWV
jgi:hypothetical protein